MESISSTIINSFNALATAAGIWQLLVITLSMFIALVVHRRWHQFIIARIGKEETHGLGRITLRGTGLVVFPLVAVVIAMTASGILSQFGIKTPFIDVLVPLVLSIAIIRAVAYTLRRVYSPSPALRAMEGMIAA
ncbi:MAG: hypothetical protein V3S12_04985, partial [Acidiferrobacterales bacterium]